MEVTLCVYLHRLLHFITNCSHTASKLGGGGAGWRKSGCGRSWVKEELGGGGAGWERSWVGGGGNWAGEEMSEEGAWWGRGWVGEGLGEA